MLCGLNPDTTAYRRQSGFDGFGAGLRCADCRGSVLSPVPGMGFAWRLCAAGCWKGPDGDPVDAADPLPAEIDEPSPLPLPLPDRPAIAVLPFNNMSGDPEQEYFSDGISEDIITALSKLRWFLVIARNSSFTYKGNAVHLKQIGAELGVRYVVEGSVRKSGDRGRITAQLNDVATGSHLWAEHYDRELTGGFA